LTIVNGIVAAAEAAVRCPCVPGSQPIVTPLASRSHHDKHFLAATWSGNQPNAPIFLIF
jgi:hypothetical protein